MANEKKNLENSRFTQIRKRDGRLVPFDARKLKTAILKAGHATGEFGDDVANGLIRNNKLITDFLGEKSVLGKVLENKNIAPEDVFKKLITNGNSRTIESLKAILPVKDIQKLKATALNSLIKRNEDGFVMFTRTANFMKNEPGLIAEFFTLIF